MIVKNSVTVQDSSYFCPPRLGHSHMLWPHHYCVVSQVEREVTEAMMKSLKYCDLQTESARQPLYQYRAATIHHRLASMYHSCFRNQVCKRTSVSPVLMLRKNSHYPG